MAGRADGSILIDTKLDTSGIQQGFNQATKLAGTAGAAIAAALAAAGTAALKVGMDFSSGMSEVQAISGATGSDLAALTQKAKEMGATTKFSASQSAEAMKYMAMAGWNAEQMIDGLPGVMNLAAASGESLASVSDIVTDALTAMGLKAEDAGHFADVLATAASSSNTNVGMMGQTFKYAAPLAGALGFSIEDLSVAIGLMANSGIKGEQAGTALRSIFTRLSKPTQESADAMERLGLEITNADGSMRPLNDIIVDMRTGFANLTEAEQASTAAALGGQEAMSGLLAIVNASDEDFDALTLAISNADGAAESMAKTMNDNLKGDMVILGSALEGLGLQVFDHFETPLRQAAQAATDAVGQMSEAFETPEMQAAMDTVAQGIGSIVTAGAEFVTEAIPQVVGGIAWLVENLDKAATVAAGAGAAFAIFKTGMQLDGLIQSGQSLGLFQTAVGVLTGKVQLAALAQNGLNLAMAAAPWALAAAGVGLVVAGAISLYKAMRETTDETKALQEQTDALAQAAGKHAQETQTENDAFAQRKEALISNRDEMFTLIGAIDNLGTEAERSAAQEKALGEAMQRLNELVPELNAGLDAQTGLLRQTKEEMLALAVAEDARQRQALAEDARTKALENQKTALEELDKTSAHVANLQAQRAEYQRTLDEDLVRRNLGNATEWAALENSIKDIDVQLAGAHATMQYWNKAVDESGAAAAQAADGYAQATTDLGAAEAAYARIAEARAQAAKGVREEYAPLTEKTQEAIQKTQEMNAALAEGNEAYAESQQAIESEANLIRALATDTAELAAKTERTAEEEGRLVANVAALEGMLGGATEAIREQGGVASLTADEIMAYGDALAAAATVADADSRMLEIRRQEYEATAQLSFAEDQLATVQQQRADIAQRIADIEAGRIPTIGDGIGSIDALREAEASLLLQEYELTGGIEALVANMQQLAADSEQTAEARAAAQAIVNEAERNGLMVTEESVEEYKRLKEEQEKSAQQAADNIAKAEEQLYNMMLQSYERYAGMTQSMTDKIKDNQELTMQSSEALMKENTRTMNAWVADMDVLAEKVAQGKMSKALLDQLREMGPEASTLTRQLVTASDEALQGYDTTFQQAGASAGEAMRSELEGAADSVVAAITSGLKENEEFAAAAKSAIDKAVGGAQDGMTTNAETFKSTGSEGVTKMKDGAEGNDEYKGAMTTVVQNAGQAAQDDVPGAGYDTAGSAAVDKFAEGTTGNEAVATGAAADTVSNAGQAAQDEVPSAGYDTAGSAAVDMYADGMRGNTNAVNAAYEMVQGAYSAAMSATDSGGFRAAGMNAAQGYAGGIYAGTNAVVSAAQQMVAAAIAATQQAQASNSPAKKFMPLGHDAVDGYIEPFETDARKSASVVAGFVDAMLEAVKAQQAATLREIPAGGSAGEHPAIPAGDAIAIERIDIHVEKLDSPEDARAALQAVADEVAYRKRHKGVI